jgi:nitroreductase
MSENHSEFDRLVKARRTSLLVDKSRAVPDSLIEEICDLAMWAPNHKRTWPWRFAHVKGEGRAAYGNTVADALATAGKDEDAVAKARTKFLRSPSLIVVGSVKGDDQLRTDENRDAVAAGIQTLLLAATARGLATYWGSCPPPAQKAVADFCGFDPGTAIIGHIYVGWPTGAPEAPPRPELRVNHIG